MKDHRKLYDNPFSGLRVLDLSQGIAGPYCGRLLHEYGAEVIKVEPPNGDWIRYMGANKNGMSALLISNNFGKKSLSIDLRQEQGRAIIKDLLKTVDILIENFRPKVMERFGLDYATVKEINPKLIYLTINGFGASGPYANKPATDSVVQAISGMTMANKDVQGNPQRIGIYIPDTVSALYAMISVSTALYARQRQSTKDSKGTHLEISLAQCCAALQAGHILNDTLFPADYNVPISVPSGIYATKDGHIVLATIGDNMWERLCDALKSPQWKQEKNFLNAASRGQNAAELNVLVAQVISTYTTEYVLQRLEQYDVLHAPVYNYKEFINDPQTKHMSYFEEQKQKPYGDILLPRHPGTKTTSAKAIPDANTLDSTNSAPYIGQHSKQILSQFGYDNEYIQELLSNEIIVQHS